MPIYSIIHYFHLVSALQRGCECTHTTVIHGPPIVLRTVQVSLCHHVATPRLCDGSTFSESVTEIRHMERAQRLATPLVIRLRRVPYDKRLRHTLFLLECRRLQADLILVFKIFKGELDWSTKHCKGQAVLTK